MDTTTPNTTSEPGAIGQQSQYFPVEFKGNGIEYTKLILVNTVLSILTLGIFSAWAKVRTKKYIYGNTYINGSNFNYHGDPLQILKGRLIIGTLFLLYVFGGKVSIVIPIAAGLIFFLAMPWLLVRGMSFNLTNTSYRNIRFGFKREYAEAYKVILLGYLVTVLTLGLGAPYFYQTFSKFRIEKSRFGKSYFKTRFTAGDFYGPYIRLIGCYVAGFVFMMMFVSLFFAILDKNNIVGVTIVSILGFAGLYGGILFGLAVFNAGMFNIIYKMSYIEQVSLQTNMSSFKLFKMYIQNILLGIVTLGFGIPYGWYRLLKYKSESVKVWTDKSQFDMFEKQNTDDTSGAIADAAGDFWDMDIGF